MIDTSDYTLEPLQTDGGLILHRGVHPRPGNSVRPSVLIVAPAEEYASPATLARLEHEHALAAGLDPQWAVRPVALGRHHGRPVLVLDDPGGEPLDRQLGQPMEVGAFLRLAIGLARAVGGVHAAGLIHKDIKPANILVNPAAGHVWLTGFGIASRLPRERHSPGPPESIAGTLAYMAPEQTGRTNRSIDSRADLYALGVTLYEMLDRPPPVHRGRSHGMGALPHRAAAGAARGASPGDPEPGLSPSSTKSTSPPHRVGHGRHGRVCPDRRDPVSPLEYMHRSYAMS